MDPVSLAIATWVALKFTDQAAGRATGKVLDLAAGAWRRGEDSPKVRAALLAVLAKAVETAVSEVYPDDIERQRHVAATLLERDEALPVVDGTDLIELDHAVLRWVAAIEAPLGDDGEPTAIEPDHPLAGALCRAILEEVRREATRTGHALHPLWTDFQLMCLSPLLSKQESRLRDYWHPNMAEDGFIGRERELLMLAAALEPEADSGRFVMLGGMGGMGKTSWPPHSLMNTAAATAMGASSTTSSPIPRATLRAPLTRRWCGSFRRSAKNCRVTASKPCPRPVA
jgi:hypothetical protein